MYTFLDTSFNNTWSFFVLFQLMIDIVFKITVMINLLTYNWQINLHIIVRVKLIISSILCIIIWDRHLLVCLWGCLKRRWTGSECGWDHLIYSVQRLNNNEKGKRQLSWAQVSPRHSPSPNSWFWIQYYQSPHLPAAMTSLPQWAISSQTVSQIKLFLSYTAFLTAMKKVTNIIR